MEVATLAPERGENFVSQNQMSAFARGVYLDKYSKDRKEEWSDTAKRVVYHVLGALGYNESDPEFKDLVRIISELKFIPGGRYLYASGRELHQVNNCLLMKCEDSREGWAELFNNAAMALMTGAGIGIDWSDLRPSGSLIRKTGGTASGPIAPMKVINEIGRNVMQGGHRRSAIWAGLNWAHDDIFAFIDSKNWTAEVRALKEKDFSFPADLDMTNISVLLDDEFFVAYKDSTHILHDHACSVYWKTLKRMLKTAEPGFSVDIDTNQGETLRNACCEITSRDDSDICNLGSINLSRIDSIEELKDVVRLGTLFLLAGSVYSDVPYAKVEEIRTKNRRLGLGLMGIHEWLSARGKKYGPDNELGDWLNVYTSSTTWADYYANKNGITSPIKTRAIAPNGTIGIVAETTTGIEPIFCTAYKRRVRTANSSGKDHVRVEYVVDPTAKRLVDEGINPNTIEDAHTLSYDYERRIEFQAWVQKYVDHAISSTINLPKTITEPEKIEQFGKTLINYLPNMRGVTVYPDGARSGQPITPVDLDYALKHQGAVFEEDQNRCVGGVCGA